MRCTLSSSLVFLIRLEKPGQGENGPWTLLNLHSKLCVPVISTEKPLEFYLVFRQGTKIFHSQKKETEVQRDEPDSQPKFYDTKLFTSAGLNLTEVDSKAI